ncbi:phosphotransferase family enzyme [Kineothrix alysoides]|uniref:Phosphotransferase family enzyme n=1 Tax=Kineothrix alysoides TaxID=1469948 RepID=A0A4R1R706_9FIRM|nr:aminoglycoside phosphotransferase family protein [Kineothrix alysoides]TCL61092.1 phosphotransferase family enzyme [Kineothrix alysoides]
MELSIEEVKNEVAARFRLPGEVTLLQPYGNGHINDTFCLTCALGEGKTKRYILQRMNDDIFNSPKELMENVVNVTSFLRKKIIAAGGDPDRETLNVVPAADGGNYLEYKGDFFRMYIFIEGATCFEQVKQPEDFYNSAVSFGNFQKLLADYPADTLHETIVNFHNTVSRFRDFKKAVEEDVCERAENVREEIQFVLDREPDTHVICDALIQKKIPLRVTHNDTKLNNIMIDNETGKGICVIDLDTVMPGSALYDYGDSIRFGANTGAEDEKNLALISLDLELFDIYTKGYLEGCGGSLTKEEIELLPMGAKLMTFECGMRFLADYLKGDVYFKIHKPEHNLDRCRTQFRLVADMESKWEQMNAIVRKYSK